MLFLRLGAGGEIMVPRSRSATQPTPRRVLHTDSDAGVRLPGNAADAVHDVDRELRTPGSTLPCIESIRKSVSASWNGPRPGGAASIGLTDGRTRTDGPNPRGRVVSFSRDDPIVSAAFRTGVVELDGSGWFAVPKRPAT